jgi:hypothetical protein
MENFFWLKLLGLVLLIVAVGLELKFYNSRLSKKQTIKLFLLLTPFLFSIFRSLDCISSSLPLIVSTVFKLTVLSSFILITRNSLIIKALKFAIYAHITFFIIHAVFLALGLGLLYNMIIGLDTQTAFPGIRLIPFRATGLFDEPSLFGMTILGLILGLLFVSNKTVKSIVPFFTFSIPVMFVGAVNIFLDSFKFKLRAVLVSLAMIIPILILTMYMFNEREATVKESPVGLRMMHLVYFAQSPNLYTGSGFCSAYGRFDLGLGRDELRENGLANFKDAGQLVFMTDRVGIVPMIIWLLLLVRFIPFKLFTLFFVYLILSKVIFYSTAGMVSILLLSKVNKSK